MTDHIFDKLNAEQTEAVSAVRGPVCILAGAGSGKTTTITRRIANQVATGSFKPDQILAVTFTNKAAKEMGARLTKLGTTGVRARTFHAEALAQYHSLTSNPREIVPSKVHILVSLVRGLPMPHKFTAVRDIANEIEWAKNRQLSAEAYLSGLSELGDRTPPIPADLMAKVYTSYELRKDKAKLIDFEDMLGHTAQLLSESENALRNLRDRYHAFTVDEYQDVNLLQQNLLDIWVGDRDDVCVVGDDYQSIFGFTGATPKYLIDFPKRYPTSRIVQLTVNYRSTPQVLTLANTLVPKMGRTNKMLRAFADDGPATSYKELESGEQETGSIIQQIRRLQTDGIELENIAILFRINGRSDDFEEALSSAHIPYQVRDASFLRRPAARAVVARLSRMNSSNVAEAVSQIVNSLGYSPDDSDVQAEEATRQADLARFLLLSEEFPGDTISGFIADLNQRFATEEEGRGVQLLTYHRSKGLEYDAVFLPRLEDKEMPFVRAKSDDDAQEERRLLYVGITRARRHLFLSRALTRDNERRRNPGPSSFLYELGLLTASASPSQRPTPNKIVVPPENKDLFEALRSWRLEESRRTAVPAFVVFNDQTLVAIASARPKDYADLLSISGIGPSKSALYGADVLELVAKHTDAIGSSNLV
ncbi:MAG: ATP-dependent DNA helicase UvrD2 [Actinomycetota bacterium]